MGDIKNLAMKTKNHIKGSIELADDNKKLIYDALDMIESNEYNDEIKSIVKDIVDNLVKSLNQSYSLLDHQSDLLITLDKVSN